MSRPTAIDAHAQAVLARIESAAARDRGSSWRAFLIPLAAATAIVGSLTFVGAVRADPAGAYRLYLWIFLAGTGALFCTVPFSLYWRKDAGFLVRQGVPGIALYRAHRGPLRRRLGHWLFLAGIATVAIHLHDIEALARQVLVVTFAGILCATVAPCVALLGGVVVVSEQAQAKVAALAGDVQAPRTAWLGIVPALGAVATVFSLTLLSAWGRNGAPAITPAVIGTLVTAIAAAALSARMNPRLAARWLPPIAREIARLDRDRFLHVEATPMSPLERAWSRIGLHDRRALRIFAKDAALLHRRHPLAAAVLALGILIHWIGVAQGPELGPSQWLALAGLGLYGTVLARRRWHPPIEVPRLLRSLPVPAAAPRRAKAHATSLWFTIVLVATAVPLVIRGTDAATLAVAISLTVLLPAGVAHHRDSGAKRTAGTGRI